MTIGLIVECVSCGTDRPDVVYYVGEDATHCADCWSVHLTKLLNAKIDFNLDATTEAIASELKNSGPLAASSSINRSPMAKVEPLGVHFFEPVSNFGSDRP